MDIKLKDYRRGAEIKLTLKDVPATMMPRAIDLFAMLLDEATEKQNAEPTALPDLRWSGSVALNPLVENVTQAYVFQTGEPETNIPHADGSRECQPVEQPKRRGRPRKADAPSTAEVELAAEVQENIEAMAEQMHGAPASEVPLESPTPTATTAPTTQDTTSQTGPTSAEPTGEPESVSTPVSEPTDTADEQPEITDSELQRYSAKLAQHFGAPQRVFDLAAKFVPEGAVPRPTNIRDNSQRWAFIKAAETESGVKYHG
jgi:hypothetical protein